MSTQQQTHQTSCPDCNAAWGTLEREFQCCDRCGYPINKGFKSAQKAYKNGQKQPPHSQPAAQLRRGN